MCEKMAVVLGQSAPPAIETGSKIKVRCASVRFPVIDHAKSFRLSLILRLRLCTYLLCRQFVFPCIPSISRLFVYQRFVCFHSPLWFPYRPKPRSVLWQCFLRVTVSLVRPLITHLPSLHFYLAIPEFTCS